MAATIGFTFKIDTEDEATKKKLARIRERNVRRLQRDKEEDLIDPESSEAKER